VAVTGGSSGIGLEAAKEYLRNGSNVTIIARNKQRLETALRQLEDYVKTLSGPPPKIMSVAVDVSVSEETFSKALLPAIEEMGEIDVLVNCAGTSVAGEFTALQEEEFERMLRINVLGSIFPTRTVIEGMKRRRRGRIVFVSSQVAQVALYGYTAYAASKWALRGLAEALQMELKPYNIYVSVVYPPDTDTPGYEVEMQSKPDITKKLSESGDVFKPEQVAANMVKYSAMGYFGIGTGLDGWLLKQLHPGMSPVNSLWEVVTGILFSPLCRIISVFYVLSWDQLCASEIKKTATPTSDSIKKKSGRKKTSKAD